jgi:hypothetical protein
MDPLAKFFLILGRSSLGRLLFHTILWGTLTLEKDHLEEMSLAREV